MKNEITFAANITSQIINDDEINTADCLAFPKRQSKVLPFGITLEINSRQWRINKGMRWTYKIFSSNMYNGVISLKSWWRMYYIYERAIEKYQINTSTTAEKICVQPEGDCLIHAKRSEGSMERNQQTKLPRIRVHFCLQRMNLSWAPEHGHPFPVAQDMFHWLLHQHYSDGSWCWVHQQLQNQPIYHNRVWFSNRRGKSHTKTCLIRRKMQWLQTMLDEWKDAMTSVFIESEIWPDGIFTVQGCINLPGWGDCPPKKMNIS